jgi:uncharacterized protein
VKWRRVFVVVLLSAALAGPAVLHGWAEKVATIPAPTGYVDDYAGVLSAPARTELEGLCREVHQQTKAQVFVVTVKTLDAEAVETFANELSAKWKIGEKKTDRGVLLLLATTDHKRWIEVGYGFEGILNDARVGDIGREMVPALKVSNFDEAARIGVRDVSRVIAADAGVTIAGLEETETAASPVGQETPAPSGIGSSSPVPAWPFALLPIVFFTVFGLIVWGMVRNRRSGASTSGGFTPGAWGDGGGGGGDSGGSDSFSGGDGGSSGGGGAGGSW